MAFLDRSSICMIEEYSNHENNRIIEANLEFDTIYTYMMRLRDSKFEAAKQAVKVCNVSKYSGLCAVEFAFLDNNLEEDFCKTEYMSDGYISGKTQGFYVIEGTGQKIELVEAYLKDYFDSGFEDILEIGCSRELVSAS